MQHGKHRKRYPAGSEEAMYWSQFKAFLRADNRIAESVAPMREHAELVESNKQNEYSARLWKHHAEQATSFNLLRAQIILALALSLETQPHNRLVVAQQLRMIAEEMQG